MTLFGVVPKDHNKNFENNPKCWFTNPDKTIQEKLVNQFWTAHVLYVNCECKSVEQHAKYYRMVWDDVTVWQ